VGIVHDLPRGEPAGNGEYDRASDVWLSYGPDGVDPGTGDYVRAADDPFDIAYDRSSGALYAVWQDSPFSNGAIDQTAFTKSEDGGTGWSTPVQIAKSGILDSARDRSLRSKNLFLEKCPALLKEA
jgi:hypothetical protein